MKKSQEQEPKQSPADKLTHQELGQKLDLFSFHDVAPGAPFWHAKGMIIVKELEKFIRKLQDQYDYQEISTPIMVKKKLFEKSGHWKFFKENMFTLKVDRETYALKPMNCPESALVYQTQIRSYRDLPLRLAEIGRLHRNELSGVLGGLLRVRQITMDDAHIYCRFDQIKSELTKVLTMTEEFYRRLGLEVSYGLATRPKKAMGDPAKWQQAEEILAAALRELNLKYQILKGEGAFYGPKVHFDINDSLNRTWTIATAQVDFEIPEQFKLEYIDAEGKKQRPVIIHRAIFGSFERFIGILLEHTQGNLPFWLAPIQTAVLSISDTAIKYANEVNTKLKDGGIRSWLNDRNETIGKKIREAELQKIPYLLVVGEKEVAAQTVAVRERGKGDLGPMPLEKFLNLVGALTA